MSTARKPAAAATPPPRSRLTPEKRRRQLVGIGLRMFADRPLDDLKIEDVAREAGISHGLLFYYFPSKRAYYLAVVEAAAAHVVELMAVPAELEDEAALRHALEQYFDLVGRRTDAYALLARSAVSADPDVAAIWEQTRGQLAGAMLKALGFGPGDDHARLIVRGWQAMIESVALDWALDWALDRPVPRDQLIGDLVAMLDAALARQPTHTNERKTRTR